MKKRFLSLMFALCLAAASLCLFTACPTGTSSLAIFHNDTLHVAFDIQDTSAKTAFDTLDLTAVRHSLDSSRIDPTSVEVTDISIKADPTDSASLAIVARDSGVAFMANTYFATTGRNWTQFLTTLDTGVTFSRLSASIRLNGLMRITSGFPSFQAAVQDPSNSTIEFKLEVIPKSNPPVHGTLRLKIAVAEEGLMKS